MVNFLLEAINQLQIFDIDTGYCTLDAWILRYWTLVLDAWILVYWMLGYWILGYWMLGYWTLDT